MSVNTMLEDEEKAQAGHERLLSAGKDTRWNKNIWTDFISNGSLRHEY
jgi:hypothetical protein